MKNKAKERIGETNINNFGSEMTIIEYENNRNATVEFKNGYVKKCEYRQFKDGGVKSPYDKTVYNKGFIGEGPHKPNEIKKYNTWKCLIERIYIDRGDKYKNYQKCSICKKWLNYQNFAGWYENSYYKVKNEIMTIDKDIICKGNKIYSPEKCVFVPQRINNLFCKSDSARGKYPIGVYYKKENNKFISSLKGLNNKRIYLGSFDSVKKAFLAYKERKEKVIKKVAEKYKNKIPKKLYNAMCNYKVEIGD